MSQRLFLYIVVVAVIFLGILFGAPVENPDEVVMELLAPLVLVLVGASSQGKVINSRVDAGSIEPGDIGAILKMRETWAMFALMGAWLLQRFGVTDLLASDGTPLFNIDLLVNMFMASANLFLYNHLDRPAGETIEYQVLEIPDTMAAPMTPENP